MRWILIKVRTSLAIRGYLGTLQLCGRKTLWLFKSLTPSYRAAQSRSAERDQEFDRKYGVETSGIVHPAQSAVRGRNWIYGIKYQPVDPIGFCRIINELSIPYGEFVFIDYGSGKGRAVLLASSFPFKRIVGIEYCDDLNRIAEQNLIQYPNARKLCKDIDLICMDAVDYGLPNEPLVLFFYNPFGRMIMEKVINQLIDSFQLNPRRMIIVYLTPDYADLWDKVWFLKRSRLDAAVWETEAK